MAQSRQTDQRLQARIRTLFDEARLPVDVDVVDGVVHLVGRVDSPRLHQAAIDLVEGLPGLSGIDDQIDYEVIAPDMATEPLDDDEQFGYADEEALDDDISDTDPTFMEEVSTRDFQEVIEEGGVWFPPTDPVVEPSTGPQELGVVGGFQPTSMEEDTDVEEDEAFEQGVPLGDGDRVMVRDDDEIRDDVMRELHEDAETIDLRLDVQVINGIVYLRGRVPTVEDAESAEAVASRVPGIVEVRDLTEVEDLE